MSEADSLSGSPDDEDEPLDVGPSGVRVIEITPDKAGGRLDKTLAEHAADLSRGRVQALMTEGLISFDGGVVTEASSRARAGLYTLLIPAPAPAEPQAEAILLSVLFEDQHLIVLDKPAGMAAHPGPGTESGTLVNALLHHCAGSLSGIGGVAR
ncbi:MAG: RluA family pseudouridine synthase, partial [Caulobacter sp.]